MKFVKYGIKTKNAVTLNNILKYSTENLSYEIRSEVFYYMKKGCQEYLE